MTSSNPSGRRFPAATVAVLASLALSACQTQPPVLARVGDRVITVAQYQAAAASAASSILLPPDSAKAELLNAMVQRELLLVASRGNDALPDSFVTRRRRAIEDEALSRALLSQMASNKAGVSDAEVKQLYLLRQQVTHCQIILTTDLEAARTARAAVDAGADFALIADRFDVTGTLPQGGDLGFVEAGALVDPLDRIVRESRVSSLVGPVETPGQGWFIIKILAREPREQGSLEEMQPQLRSMLEQRKQRIALARQYAALRSEYRIASDPGGVRTLYQRLNATRQLAESGGPASPPLSPQERATVVGRWDGGARATGTLTLGEAMELIESGEANPLNRARLDAYDDWVKNTVIQRVAVTEARRRHLDEEPQLAERTKQAIEGLLLQSMYQLEVLAQAEPNDAEIIAAYERNAPAFAQLKSVSVQYMTLPESTMAVRAAEMAMEAGTLKDAVMLASAKWGVREAVLRFPVSDPFWQMLQPALTQQHVGGLVGPIHLSEGWRVVQIIGRDAPVPRFESLTPQQQDGIKQQARQSAGERRLTFYTDSLRKAVPVVVDRERLKRIAWPGPNVIKVMPGASGVPGL